MAKYVAEVNVDMECWITNPDAVEGGYIKGVCAAVSGDTYSVKVGGQTLTGDNEGVFPAEPEQNPAVPDNCGLMYLNEATMLENLRRRFLNDEIYTFTANILIAINPYKDMSGVYTDENIARYQGMSIGALDPHIYAIGDKSYRDMRNLGLSQCILCSGESGAGKTESTKHLLRYLTDSYGGGGDVSDLESRILAANPLLESFGNAKTTRNNNSSRFGKFVELHFNRNHKVIGAHILHYLLEKSRVISQNNEERNYHVFYRIIRGAPDAMRKALDISPDAATYNYMKQSMLEDIRGLDDKKDFAMMERAMTDCGLTPDEKSNVFRITTAVLHIGNLELEDSGDGCRIANDDVVSTVCRLLGLDTDKFKEAMCFKTIQIGKQESLKALSALDAGFSKNGLGKSLYSKLFDWIIERANECFPFPKERSVNYIGILDIAGFEYFKHNSFEQFCINYCNEKLQQFFNERTLRDEQELYIKESINFNEVEFVDNQDTVELIETPKTGILGLLDECSKMPRANDRNFCEKLHSTYKNHFRLQLPRKSKMAGYSKMRDDEGFIIRHFAGAVGYEVDGFMEKNNDALTADLAFLMDASSDPFLVKIFTPRPGEPRPKRGKLTLISLGDKFKKALAVLLEKLNSCRASFVRCVKPNSLMKSKVFTAEMILAQLQCAGMVSVLDLMQGGFPSRTKFDDLYNMYKSVLPPELAALDPRTFSKALFKALGMKEADFQFGVSRVFFRPGKFAEFDRIMRADPESLVELVAKVQVWLMKSRVKKIAWSIVASIKFDKKIKQRGAAATLMQNIIKMHVYKNSYRPRYVGIAELSEVTEQISGLRNTIDKLKKNKEKFYAQVEGIVGALNGAIDQIKCNDDITRAQIKAMRTELDQRIEKELEELMKEQKRQKLAEEAERLRKLAEEREKERLRKIAEEEARKQAEIDEAKRLEEEKKARKDQAAMEAQMADMKSTVDAAEASAPRKSLAERQRDFQEKAQLDQERRDQELALRLAMDAGAGGAMAQLTSEAQHEASIQRKAMRKSRKVKVNGIDLSSWKFSQLKETLKTSHDMKMLEACKAEFHRRLKVYEAWKKEKEVRTQGLKKSAASRGAAPAPPPNARRTANGKPRDLANRAAARAPAPTLPKAGGASRRQFYFRIPFVPQGLKKKGWWYAHFDGQWVARQMELHPQKPPVLLLAGRDASICEKSLEETGLLKKEGARIDAKLFEQDWLTNGGRPYRAQK